MSMDITNIKMPDRMPSFWNERMEVTIDDLTGPVAADPNFNRVRDLAVFWRGEEEIDSERGQPPAVNAPFSLNSFDYLGWGDISESMREEFMKLRELIDALESQASAKHKGLVDGQALARGAFDRLEEEVNEVFSELGGRHDVTHSESALADNQSDAYSELTDSYYDGPLDKGPLPYIPDMAA